MSPSRPGSPPDPARNSGNGQNGRPNLSLELLATANQSDEPGNWLVSSALPALATNLAAGYVAVVVAEGGRWNVLAEAGPACSLPAELLAEVLDREVVRSHGNWVAGPLAPRAVSAEALVACWPAAPPPDALVSVQSLLPVLREALASVRARHRQLLRIGRLETILDITSRWYQTREIEPLLVQMAEAATRLLKADRASIFLWDRANHCLIGRPALGVKGGELRVADDRGVVGGVLQSPRSPKRSIIASMRNFITTHGHCSAFPCKRGRASDSARSS